MRCWLPLCAIAAISFASIPLASQTPAPVPVSPEIQKQLDDARALEPQNRTDALKRYLASASDAAKRGDTAGEGVAWYRAGLAAERLNQRADAETYLQKSIPLLDAAGRLPAAAYAVNSLGIMAFETGRIQPALKWFENALTRYRTLKDTAGEGFCLSNIGNAHAISQRYEDARRSYDLALPLLRQVKDRSGEASALLGIANIDFALGNYDQAESFYNQALPIYQELKNSLGELRVLNNLGGLAIKRGEMIKARTALERLLPLQLASQNKPSIAATRNSLGYVYREMGLLPEAIVQYDHALTLFREMDNQREQAAILSNIGGLYLSIFEARKGKKILLDALALARRTDNKDVEGTVLSMLGSAASGLGEFADAKRYYEQALERQTKWDPDGAAITYHNAASLYQRMGQPLQAIALIEKSLRFWRKTNAPIHEADDLALLGSFYVSLGQPERALDFYHRALPLLKQSGNGMLAARVANDIGTALLTLNRPKEALPYFEQFRDFRVQAKDTLGTALANANIADVKVLQGHNEEALAIYRQVAEVIKDIGLPLETGNLRFSMGITLNRLRRFAEAETELQAALKEYRRTDEAGRMAEALAQLARSLMHQNKIEQADAAFAESLTLRERLRETLDLRSESRQKFLASAAEFYQDYLRFLLSQGRTRDAFALAQKNKSRTLLDLMGSSRAGTALIPAAERKQEQRLRIQCEQISNAIVQESIQNRVGSKARTAALKQKLQQAEGELDAFLTRLYAQYPDLARRRIARTVTANDTARWLTPDTALLEWTTVAGKTDKDDAQIAVFVLTRKRQKIDIKAHLLPVSASTLAKQITSFRQACADPRQTYLPVAQQMEQTLLSAVNPSLVGKTRLIVCPDGLLWDVPFAALHNGKRFLAERFRLAHAGSATGAAMALTSKPRSAQRLLLALANPDFGGTRIAGNPLIGQRPLSDPARPISEPARPISEPTRAVTVQRNGALVELKGTQKEADWFQAHLPNALVLTRTKAQESAFKQNAARFRWIHLASHAFFNDAAPLYSGVLLAKPKSNSGQDGYLTARELLDMNLSADMVVLSACNTARGSRRSGEGMVGLTWALFASGVPSQILSQWSVDDAATAVLMPRFYAGIKAGKDKSAALQSASLAVMRTKPQWRHPYYWSPFLLMGSWK